VICDFDRKILIAQIPIAQFQLPNFNCPNSDMDTREGYPYGMRRDGGGIGHKIYNDS